MPEEVLVVIIIAIVAGSISLVSIARMLFKYLNARAGLAPQVENPSFTTSELEQMLRRVARESNQPLLDRIEALEEQLTPESARLLDPSSKSVLELNEPEVLKVLPRQKT